MLYRLWARPVEGLKVIKRERNWPKVVAGCISQAVLFTIIALLLGYYFSEFKPLVEIKSYEYLLLGTFGAAFLGALFFAWPLQLAVRSLRKGGKQQYFEGLASIVYPAFVLAAWGVAASLAIFVPIGGQVISLALWICAGMHGFALFAKSIQIYFDASVATTLLVLGIAVAGVLLASSLTAIGLSNLLKLGIAG